MKRQRSAPNAQNELKRIDTRLAWDARYREFLCELAADKPVVTGAAILNEVYGSDHCPVELTIEL